MILTIRLQVIDDSDRDGVPPLRVNGRSLIIRLVTLCSEKSEAE